MNYHQPDGTRYQIGIIFYFDASIEELNLFGYRPAIKLSTLLLINRKCYLLIVNSLYTFALV